jgi:hypothetical protein
MNDFIRGFKKGAKETPLGFFAPAIAIWRLFSGVTESLMRQANHQAKSEQGQADRARL